MLRNSTAMALALAVLAGPAFAQAEWTFADVDQDNNLELTEREFEPVSRDAFDRLDANDDDALSEDEFAQARDDLASDGEADFADWDSDADGTVDREEFRAGLFAAYDEDDDELLAEQEFTGLGETAMLDGSTVVGERALQTDEIVSLSDWTYDDLYAGGLSVEDFMDEMEVVGTTGEEIGSIEDVIFGQDGRVLAVIAEVGGFWDMFDTHVSVPWNEVEVDAAAERIVLPVTEETVEEYGVLDADYITAEEAATDVVTHVDDAETGPRAWRATELIGDYARLQNAETWSNYGYVNDVIIKDGQIAAVVVSPDAAWGTGPYAYPYFGYGYGWRAGTPYYDLPYNQGEVAELETFEEDRITY